MIKITPETIDYLMCEEHLCELLVNQRAKFQTQFLTFFALYQKKLDDALSAAPTSKPVSEPAAEPGLCPVAEQVADLTEQVADLTEQVADLTERLDAALERLVGLEAVANANQRAIYLLTHVAENHTNALDNLHDAVVQALGLRHTLI